jgi:PII-like signaling protein
MKMKMWCLMIRIKRNDEVDGKRIQKVLLDLLRKEGVMGTTVWAGVNGFGKRGRSTLHMEGISVNMPLIIEVIDWQTKLESLLPEIKRLVDDNGLLTIHEVDAL